MVPNPDGTPTAEETMEALRKAADEQAAASQRLADTIAQAYERDGH